MRTYTVTVDVGAGPWENGTIWKTSSANCPDISVSWPDIITLIQNLAAQIGDDISTYYAGTYSYTINGSTITWTFNLGDDPAETECGDLTYLYIPEAASEALTPFQYITPELCQTCQDVTMDNCGSIIFEAAIPNGTYEVQIEDHQSGITYMQDIEFTASQGTWDQTNTAGVFTPFSTYTVTIFDQSGVPVSWVDGTKEYTCMRLTFATFTDTTPQG